MRIMGLDYGSVTVGVAVSDALLLTAQGVETIFRKEENKLRRTLARIQELCTEYEVGEIVVGFPKHMNNTIGDRAEKSLAFAEDIPVYQESGERVGSAIPTPTWRSALRWYGRQR